MKNLIQLSFIFLIIQLSYSQVGIQTSTPSDDSDLTLGSTNKGLLLNRVALTATNVASPLSANVAGMVVYNTATAGTAPSNVIPGYYYNDGNKWVRLLTSVPDQTIDVSGITAAQTSPATFAGGTFAPNIPANADYIYVNTADGTTWTYDPATTKYKSYIAPASTEWNFIGTTNDAGGNKTSAIHRTGKVAIGTGSTLGAVATNPGAFAAGTTAIASGTSSIALGHTVTASGAFSFAGGYNNAVGGSYSASFGNSNANSGSYSFVAGNGNSNAGTYNVLGGWANTAASGTAVSTAFGYGNNITSGFYSLAAGYGNTIGGAGTSFAAGYQNSITNSYNAAFGKQNTISGQYNVAGGVSNNISGSYSVAHGGTNTVSSAYSAAIGNNNTASGDHSLVFGNANNSTGSYTTTIGGSNFTTSGSYSLGINLDTTAQTLAQANTMAIMGGKVGIGTVTPSNTLEIKSASADTSGLTLTNLTQSSAPVAASVANGKYLTVDTSGKVVLAKTVDSTIDVTGLAASLTSPNAFTGATFNPASPANSDYIYINKADGTTWTYNGTQYVSYTAPASTEWYLAGTTNDAGGNKTSGIYRNAEVKVGGNTTGSLIFTPGTASHAGAMVVVKGDGTTRLGYIGWDNTNLTYEAENSAKHIFNGGDVGINVIPTEKLEVAGNILASNKIISGKGAIGKAALNNGTTGQAGYLEIYKGDGTTRLGYIGYDNNNLNYNSENGASHTFTGGNVGIGTTPTQALDVNGAVRIRTIPTGSGTPLLTDANGNVVKQSSGASGTNSGIGAGSIQTFSTGTLASGATSASISIDPVGFGASKFYVYAANSSGIPIAMEEFLVIYEDNGNVIQMNYQGNTTLTSGATPTVTYPSGQTALNTFVTTVSYSSGAGYTITAVCTLFGPGLGARFTIKNNHNTAVTYHVRSEKLF